MCDRDSDSPHGLWTAFEAEAMPHVDRLFRLAMWWERDRREAEDLVQDTLVQALQSFHRFTAGTNCRAWLVTILQHVRSNRRRAKTRVPPVPQHLTDEDVLAALRGIPEAFQDIILLSDVEELTYKEIATVLKIPIGTVMSRLHRGRTMLRQHLGSRSIVGGAARTAKLESSEGSR